MGMSFPKLLVDVLIEDIARDDILLGAKPGMVPDLRRCLILQNITCAERGRHPIP